MVKEGDDIALEIQTIQETKKRFALTQCCSIIIWIYREIEKKYENKLKEQNRSWSREIEKMSEAYNQKVIEMELLQRKHQDEIEAIKSDLQDAKVVRSYQQNSSDSIL